MTGRRVLSSSSLTGRRVLSSSSLTGRRILSSHSIIPAVIYNSYQRLSLYVTENTDISDIESGSEEASLYECFVKLNIVRDNVGSTTVEIENNLVQLWNSVLSSVYGPPLSQSKNDGNKWKVRNYADSGRDITISIWNQPRDDKPKILVQAGSEYDKLFVTAELPLIYQKVLQQSAAGVGEVPPACAAAPDGPGSQTRRSKRSAIPSTPRGYLTHPKRHSSVMTPLPRVSKRLKMKTSARNSFIRYSCIVNFYFNN